MSKYREEELFSKDIPSFDDIECLEKLKSTSKLTSRHKEALRKLLQYWYEH